jgi:hypothetical protein
MCRYREHQSVTGETGKRQVPRVEPKLEGPYFALKRYMRIGQLNDRMPGSSPRQHHPFIGGDAQTTGNFLSLVVIESHGDAARATMFDSAHDVDAPYRGIEEGHGKSGFKWRSPFRHLGGIILHVTCDARDEVSVVLLQLRFQPMESRARLFQVHPLQVS